MIADQPLPTEYAEPKPYTHGSFTPFLFFLVDFFSTFLSLTDI
jgi:hypothetical protein